MNRWWAPARRPATAAALLAATATATLAVAVVDPRFVAGTAALATGFVVAAVVACARPSAVAGPVLLGAGLAWPVALGRHGAAWAVPVVVGVVLVAELLGAVDEHRSRVASPAEASFGRAAAAAVLAAAVAAVVATATALPGPG